MRITFSLSPFLIVIAVMAVIVVGLFIARRGKE
jgi:uncharacterized protein YneF (UPF0154 family)